MPAPPPRRAAADGGTWQCTLVRHRTDDADLLASGLWAAGATGVWVRPDEVVGYFPTAPGTDASEVLEGGRWAPVPDVDWTTRWREGLAPVAAGPFDIVPTWLVDDHPPRPDRIRIVLDPSGAFGSGHHDTTLGCLEDLGAADLHGASVLDVGTGTGILAIAAAGRGAGRVVGMDTDPDAIEVASANARANDVTLELAVGSVGDVAGPFDLVVANLLTHTLVELAGDLVAALGPRGALVTSGIGAPRAELVVAALTTAGLEQVTARVRGGWAIVAGRR